MQKIAVLATMMIAALSASILISPWRPSPKLQIAAFDYISAAVAGMGSLLSDPLAIVLITAACAGWRLTAGPVLAGAVYALLDAALKYGAWSKLGLSLAKQAEAAGAAGAQVCSLSAMVTALVTALFVLAQEREAPQPELRPQRAGRR